MSEGPWIRFFPSDWLGGTRGMSAAVTGIYITLIMRMYENGGPLTDDRTELARLCGTTPAALKAAIDLLERKGKLEIVDGGLWNGKVGVETEFRRSKSHGARASAAKRWGKKDQQKQSSDDANALPTHSEGICLENASHSHEPEDASQAQHPATLTRADLDSIEAKCREAAGLETDPSPGLLSLAPIVGLIQGGHDLDLDVLPTLRAKRGKGRPRTWDYFTEAISEASAKRRGLAASGLAPAIAGQATNVFQRLQQDLTDGPIRGGRSDGLVVDAVRSLPDLRGQIERDDGEGVPDGNRGLHAAGAA